MDQRLQSPPTGSRPFRMQTSASVTHKLHYRGESTEEHASLVAGVNKLADRIWIYFRMYGNMLSAVICVNFNINDVQEAN